MPFLAGFYPRDFILEMFSMRYVNMFGFFLLFVSTGLTVCYSFPLFYFVLCSDFNFIPSYSMVETNYNIIGTIGLLVMSIFGGGSVTWLICLTPSVICLPYYLRFLTLFVVFLGGWFQKCDIKQITSSKPKKYEAPPYITQSPRRSGALDLCTPGIHYDRAICI